MLPPAFHSQNHPERRCGQHGSFTPCPAQAGSGMEPLKGTELEKGQDLLILTTSPARSGKAKPQKCRGWRKSLKAVAAGAHPRREALPAGRRGLPAAGARRLSRPEPGSAPRGTGQRGRPGLGSGF